jgi:hypothetical protein
MVRFNIEMLAERDLDEPVSFMGVSFISEDELEATIEYCDENIRAYYTKSFQSCVSVARTGIGYIETGYDEEDYETDFEYYYCAECGADIGEADYVIEHCRDHVRGDI